jgi:3-oxoacyl-[acyl-carrier protein] reductase
MELRGRRALLTGASGGIGGALAVLLAEAGADLVLTYSGHRAEAEAVARQVDGHGRTVEVLQADLGEPGAGRNLVSRAGDLDVLVANAGAAGQTPWDAVDDALWARTFAVNTTATWEMTQAALPGMVERGFGRILYVSSIAAMAMAMLTNPYLTNKVITVDGGLYPA